MGNRDHDDLVFDDSIDHSIWKPVQSVAPNPIRKRMPRVRTFQYPAFANSDFCKKALIKTVRLRGIPRHGFVQFRKRWIEEANFHLAFTRAAMTSSKSCEPMFPSE